MLLTLSRQFFTLTGTGKAVRVFLSLSWHQEFWGGLYIIEKSVNPCSLRIPFLKPTALTSVAELCNTEFPVPLLKRASEEPVDLSRWHQNLQLISCEHHLRTGVCFCLVSLPFCKMSQLGKISVFFFSSLFFCLKCSGPLHFLFPASLCVPARRVTPVMITYAVRAFCINTRHFTINHSREKTMRHIPISHVRIVCEKVSSWFAVGQLSGR